MPFGWRERGKGENSVCRQKMICHAKKTRTNSYESQKLAIDNLRFFTKLSKYQIYKIRSTRNNSNKDYRCMHILYSLGLELADGSHNTNKFLKILLNALKIFQTRPANLKFKLKSSCLRLRPPRHPPLPRNPMLLHSPSEQRSRYLHTKV
jgi:hypothetical protein